MNVKSRELTFSSPLQCNFTCGGNSGQWLDKRYNPPKTTNCYVENFWGNVIGYDLSIDDVWAMENSNYNNFIGYERFNSTRLPRPHFNNCEHLRNRLVARPATFTVSASVDNKQFYLLYKTAPPLKNIPKQYKLVEEHPALNLHQAQTTAWHIMQPRFEGDISMFNFILELKDMRSLLHALRSKPLRKIRNFFNKKKRKIDPTKPLAQTYLANEFALKPLLTDILTISQQIEDKISDIQQGFADAGREISSRHYSESFNVVSLDIRTSTLKRRQPGTPIGSYSNTVFTATMEHSYRYNMRSTLDALTKYWGLKSSREAIWNAIPFSFVLDYFINIGDCIHLTEHDKNVGLQLHQYCESLLTQSLTGNFVIPSSTWDGVQFIGDSIACTFAKPTNWYLLSGVESTLYTRWRCGPNYGIVVPRIRIPSGKQMLNLAALLRGFF